MTPAETPDWRKLSREELDRGLNNSEAVAGSGEIVAGWDRRSADLRKQHASYLDVSYGPARAQPHRLSESGRRRADAALYPWRLWQMRAKEAFTLFATGPMAHGINVALTGYTLAPEATLDEIVAEVHAAIDFLCQQLPALGGDGKGVVVSGWSAGGHLTAMALSHPKVRAGMAISGIYDLEPIRHSYLNVKLGLDEAASRRNSPVMMAGGPMKPLSLVVGSGELPLLRKQTADFAGHRAQLGLPVTYEEIPGADHFTIMDEMAAPEGRITTLIRQLFERTDG